MIESQNYVENNSHISIPQLTDLACKALGRYAMQVKDVTFIQHSENVTFKVTTAEEPYLLRLHYPLTKGMGTHGSDAKVVSSELLWIDSLRRSRLLVPRPIRNRVGKLVTRVHDSSRKPVNVTVLEWLDGDLYTREMETEDSVAQIGSLAGRMHRHASRWRLPHGFKRPVRGADYFIGVLESLQPAVDDGRIDYRDFKALQSSIYSLAEILQQVRKTRSVMGLIHGDLHRGNFLDRGGEIRLIDFSLCAFGHFTYDLGTCMSNINPAYHPVFLDSYCRHFPLPSNYERLIEGFLIASHVVTFSFWLENPEAQETLVQRVPYVTQEYASRFNRDEQFWF